MRLSPLPPCPAVRTFLLRTAIAGLLVLRAWAAEDAGRTFGDSVGLNVKFSQGQPMSELPLLKELGVKWVRDSVDWPVMEPEAGKYAGFPPAFRERLIYYKENGIGVVFGLWYANAKAYPDTPEHPHHSVDAAAYGRYAAAMARKLRETGVRFVLELWNEPHNFVLKKKLGGEWQGKPPSPWVDHYVAMVREAVKQVKAADPQVRLIAGDDMWVLDDWFLEKGLPPELDALGIHPYAPQGPEMTAVDQDTDWAKPFTLTDADRSLRSAVRRLREQALLKMGRTPAIWATEWGWKDDATRRRIGKHLHTLPPTITATCQTSMNAPNIEGIHDDHGTVSRSERRKPGISGIAGLCCVAVALIQPNALAQEALRAEAPSTSKKNGSGQAPTDSEKTRTEKASAERRAQIEEFHYAKAAMMEEVAGTCVSNSDLS